MGEQVRIAVIGHGEVGSRVARSLASAGADVVGFDVKPPAQPTVPLVDSIAYAVAGADVVFTVNSANVALRVAEQVAPLLGADALYADLNVGPPALKRRLADVFAPEQFVDAAAMRLEPRLQLALAGAAAERLHAQLAPLALDVEVVSAAVGDAAARTLTRSLFGKVLASAVVDYLWAAQAMGIEEWAYDELLAEFDAMTAETAKHALTATVGNPKKLEIEMLDIVEMLEGAGYHSMFVPPTQLVYNKVYHSIKVPFGTEAEQHKHASRNEAPAADW